MSELLHLIEKIQYGDDSSLVNVIHQFEPKVNRLLKQTDSSHKEDLRQELFLEIIVLTKKYKIEKVPDFNEFKRNMMLFSLILVINM